MPAAKYPSRSGIPTVNEQPPRADADRRNCRRCVRTAFLLDQMRLPPPSTCPQSVLVTHAKGAIVLQPQSRVLCSIITKPSSRLDERFSPQRRVSPDGAQPLRVRRGPFFPVQMLAVFLARRPAGSRTSRVTSSPPALRVAFVSCRKCQTGSADIAVTGRTARFSSALRRSLRRRSVGSSWATIAQQQCGSNRRRASSEYCDSLAAEQRK